jgi:hypothetical protein
MGYMIEYDNYSEYKRILHTLLDLGIDYIDESCESGRYEGVFYVDAELPSEINALEKAKKN